LETIAALIAHRLDHSDLLVESPEKYIDAAVRTGSRRDEFRYSAFTTSTPDATPAAEALITDLKDQGLSLIYVSIEDLENSGSGWPDVVEESQHAIFIFGRDQLPMLETQLRRFAKLTLDEDKPRGVITIISETNTRPDLPPLLAGTQLTIPQGNNIGILSSRIAGIISNNDVQKNDRASRPFQMAIGSLNDNDPLVREGGARALLRMDTPDALEAVFLRLGDENEAVRGVARSILPRTQDLKERLLINLEAGISPSDIKPVELAVLLGELRDARALDSLLNLLRHREPPVRAAAARALGQIDDPRAIDWLLPRLSDADEMFVARLVAL
jgi:hypothetical protein